MSSRGIFVCLFSLKGHSIWKSICLINYLVFQFQDRAQRSTKPFLSVTHLELSAFLLNNRLEPFASAGISVSSFFALASYFEVPRIFFDFTLRVLRLRAPRELFAHRRRGRERTVFLRACGAVARSRASACSSGRIRTWTKFWVSTGRAGAATATCTAR